MCIREEQCGSKRQFDTMNQARKALKRMRSTDGLRPYFCPYCHWFHIGNSISDKHEDKTK